MKNSRQIQKMFSFCLFIFAVVTARLHGQDAADVNVVIPSIIMDNMPLADGIKNLARQAGLNYILDPHVASEVDSSILNFTWKNLTAKDALVRILQEHHLVLVENPSTAIARIAPLGRGVKPLDSALVGEDTNTVIPVILMDEVPFRDAVVNVAAELRMKVTIDDAALQGLEREFGTVPACTLRWEKVTAKQALVALLDNYDLILVQDPGGATARVTIKSGLDWPTETVQSDTKTSSSMARRNNFTVAIPQIAVAIPVLIISIIAVVVCLMNWQRARTAALFCLIGFGLIGFNSLLGIVAYGFIFNYLNGDHTTLTFAYTGLSVMRALLSMAGLVFLLVAVFSQRGHKVNSGGPR